MVKYQLLILLGASIMLVGCGGKAINIKTEVQETFVPILYSPAPPVITRPELPIYTIPDNINLSDGEIVKQYKATIRVLLGYSTELEDALNEYNKINKSYKEFEDEIRKKLGDNATNLPVN